MVHMLYMSTPLFPYDKASDKLTRRAELAEPEQSLSRRSTERGSQSSTADADNLPASALPEQKRTGAF